LTTPSHRSADFWPAPRSAGQGLPPLPGDPSDPFEIAVHRGSPPPELVAQMAQAERVGARLRERGLRIGFSCEPDRAPEAALYASGGERLRTLSLAEAADIAVGCATP
jgi:hypothetical protein